MSTRQDKKSPAKKQRPATTPEARENQLIAAAVDLAEAQIRDGTASSQVISHFLKLGSSREKLEQERLQKELELTEKKMEALEATARLESVAANALEAMRAYTGQTDTLVVVQDEGAHN
jgi:hypothetical protein